MATSRPPCRVFIYAVEPSKPLSSYPVEWQMMAHNAQVLGYIPHSVDMPTGCIVGWVDVSIHGDIPKLWNFGENLFPAFNAHVLDEPFHCNIEHEVINFNLELFSPPKKHLINNFAAVCAEFWHTFAVPLQRE